MNPSLTHTQTFGQLFNIRYKRSSPVPERNKPESKQPLKVILSAFSGTSLGIFTHLVPKVIRLFRLHVHPLSRFSQLVQCAERKHRSEVNKLPLFSELNQVPLVRKNKLPLFSELNQVPLVRKNKLPPLITPFQSLISRAFTQRTPEFSGARPGHDHRDETSRGDDHRAQ